MSKYHEIYALEIYMDAEAVSFFGFVLLLCMHFLYYFVRRRKAMIWDTSS